MRLSRREAMAGVLWLLAGARGVEAEQAEGAAGASVFGWPAARRRALEALALAARGEAPAAEALLAAGFPPGADPVALAATAALAAARDETEAALAALAAALDAGFAEAAPLAATPAFAGLRADPRLAALLRRDPGPPAAAPALAAALAREGIVLVSAANTSWNPALGMLTAGVAFPDQASRRRLAGARAPETPAARLVARLVARGQAAGLHGDLYDNRDRGHSGLRLDRHPQLTAVTYDAAAQAAGVDYGLNEQILFDAVTIGNSSTALTAGPFRRSLARLALTRSGGPEKLALQHGANHLYVYPEHRDHDPEHGDLFPANTPYMLVSQGSSGSDRPILEALMIALAALRPETKALLRERGLIASTLQMLFRRAMRGVKTDEDYLSGAAHPSAFSGDAIEPERLARLANALTADAAPPLATLEVESESAEGPPADPFGDAAAERLFDTPAAIARLAQGAASHRRYVLRATTPEESRPLVFRWRVLRGVGVTVTPVDPEGRRAAVEVPWQEPSPVPGVPELTSARVDVGLFVEAGGALSAPAFLSVAFPVDRTRRIDAAGRLAEIDYERPPTPEAHVDPLLWPLRPWRDGFRYGPDGALEGWIRRRADGETEFCREGRKVLERDAEGRPLLTQEVNYTLSSPEERDGRVRVVEAESGRVFAHRYAGPDDWVGTRTPRH